MANEFWAAVGAREYRNNYEPLNKKERTHEDNIKIIENFLKEFEEDMKWIEEEKKKKKKE
ncbi:MAG: hypothetical protein HQK67_12780 [Desulfamplus sp.]|nr:hypothetical protein [Desulfamplus sp.]